MSDSSDKDFGPSVVAAMLGVCIASYVEHDVTKEEFLELAGDIYDGVAEATKQMKRGGH